MLIRIGVFLFPYALSKFVGREGKKKLASSGMNRDELDRCKEGGHGAYKGDDGLSDAERIAYAACNAVSLFVSSLFLPSTITVLQNQWLVPLIPFR
jgi:hypothetical protein